MVCIYCGNKTHITNSRPQAKTGTTWRRHECQRCHAVFSSTETPNYFESYRVKKRSGIVENFSRDKLYLSVVKACDHLPSPSVLSTELTRTAIGRLFAKKPMSPIIESALISTMVAQVLKNYNAAASVKYLSFQTTMSSTNDVRRTLKR
jgi:transcriptional repressor NrdR